MLSFLSVMMKSYCFVILFSSINIILGLIQLQELFQSINNREYALEIDVKRVENVKTCLKSLKEMYIRSHGNQINVLFDLPYKEVINILAHVVS